MSLVVPRALFLNPSQNAVFAVPAVAISLFVFAYSTLFGQISILVFYALWLPILFNAPGILATRAQPILMILALPALAVGSVLWTDAPGATLRASIQYGTTVLCGLVAARIVSVRSLAVGGLIGGLAVLLYSHSDGKYGYDFVDATYAFQGAFQSKNQLGFYASLTALFGLAVAVMSGTRLILRPVAFGIAAFAVWTLTLTDSATSVLSLAAGVLAILAVILTMRIGIAFRAQSIAVFLCIATALAAVAIQAGALDTIFAVFGKDPTLTGRTYLWNQGVLFGQERPVLGLGYNAFWQLNRPEAEDLWREFYISSRTGFHFHNTLIESYVALGIGGVLLVAGWTLALLLNSVRVVMNTQLHAEAALCVGLALIFVIRSFVEIDFFTPYTAGSFLVPYLLVQMSDQRRSVMQHRHRARPTLA